jgi:hypothetical protein
LVLSLQRKPTKCTSNYLCMEHWWNDTDKGNWSTGRKTLYSVGGRWMNEYGALVEWYWQGTLKYREKTLSKWHSVHLKSHMDCWDRMLTSAVRVRRLTAWHMSRQTFRSDAVTQQWVLRVLSRHSLTHSPFSSGSFCSSRFLLMLNLDELCRLSFLMCGGPGYLILLIWVGGGTLAPGDSCCCCGCCWHWGDGGGCVELELVFICKQNEQRCN